MFESELSGQEPRIDLILATENGAYTDLTGKDNSKRSNGKLDSKDVHSGRYGGDCDGKHNSGCNGRGKRGVWRKVNTFFTKLRQF